MIKWQTQFIAILTAGIFLTSVIYLIRKKALKEEYSILWLITSAVIVLSSLFAGDILRLFQFVNPDSYGDILFFLIIVAQFGFILLFSVKLSTVKDQNRNLAQTVALLRREVMKRPSMPTESSNAEEGGQNDKRKNPDRSLHTRKRRMKNPKAR